MMYAGARRRRGDVLFEVVDRGHAGVTADVLRRALLVTSERARAVLRRDLRWLLAHGLVEAAPSEYSPRGRRVLVERWYASKGLLVALRRADTQSGG